MIFNVKDIRGKVLELNENELVKMLNKQFESRQFEFLKFEVQK